MSGIITERSVPLIFSAAKSIFDKAAAMHQRGQIQDALDLYEPLQRLMPEHYDLFNNTGAVYAHQQRHDEAAEAYAHAITLDGTRPLAYANMGAALSQMQRPDMALAYLRRGYRADATAVQVMVNLTDALIRLNRFREAEAVCRAALFVEPSNIPAQINLGVSRWGCDDIAGARETLEKMITAGDATPLVKKNAGLLALLDGDYARGWDLWRARFKSDDIVRTYAQMLDWRGGPPQPDAEMFVCGEQGLGDEILFLSMAEDLKKAWQGVVKWSVDARLLPLLALTDWGIEFSARGREEDWSAIELDMRNGPQPLPKTPHRVRMDTGSVGEIVRPDINAVPAHTGYLKAPPCKHVLPEGKLIGVAWRSVNAMFGASKTVPLDNWRGLFAKLKAQGYTFVNLQHDADDAECQEYGIVQISGLDVRNDLGGVASVMARCAHVVTVSGVTAHLAGALGVAATVLVTRGIGRFWYWGRGETTPWYPSLRIMRADSDRWTPALETLDIAT